MVICMEEILREKLLNLNSKLIKNRMKGVLTREERIHDNVTRITHLFHGERSS